MSNVVNVNEAVGGDARSRGHCRWRSLLPVVAIAGLLAGAVLWPGGAGAQEGNNIGAGVVAGEVHFPTKPIPPLNAPCAETSFTLNGLAEGFGLNTAIAGFVGPVDIAGSGGSSCEAAFAGSGTLTLTDVRGNGPNESRIDCANPATGTTLTGGYTRTRTSVRAVLGGTCIVNQRFSAGVSFIFQGEFVPTNDGGGITTPIRDAEFAGPFVVAPA